MVHVRCKNKIDNVQFLRSCLFRKTWLKKFWLRNNTEEHILEHVHWWWTYLADQWKIPLGYPLRSSDSGGLRVPLRWTLCLRPSPSYRGFVSRRIRRPWSPINEKKNPQTSPSCTQEPAVSDLVTLVVS